ncbi:unnamed protein product, partial [Rotaria magnacalcarata]
NIPEFISKHHQHTNEEIIDTNPDQGAQWYGPLQRPPHPEQYRIPMSQ